MKKLFWSAGAAALSSAALLALSAGSASAAQYITDLEYTQAGFTGPLATVTMTDGSGYVDVLVAFVPGSQLQNLVDTGTHVTFGFNLLNSADHPTDPTSVTFVQPAADPDYHYGNVAGGLYQQDPFKNFTNAIYYDSTGRGNGNNAVPPPLEFRVNAPGISFLGTSADHFTSTIGGGIVDGFDGGWWFAADVQNTTGTTFTVAGRDFCTVGVNCGGVPEPASWALMLLGFGGLGAALRRRRAATALA